MTDDTVDIRGAAAPKSDQLNAEDLIGAPRTVTITNVTAGSAEQPVVVHFSGDNGRPYKPCKSMLRVMIAAWGDDGKEWVGQSMTLYHDPEVMFGGVKVGGIRISHVSGIDQPLSLSLTATRGKRKPYRVDPLPADAAQAPAEYPAADFEANLPAWRQAIADGKLTADQVIQRASQKGTLTDAQKEAIRAPIEAPAEQQPAEPQGEQQGEPDAFGEWDEDG
ncbi:MAG: hypothetical protein ACOCP9_03200 [Halofilum sp. (in: g-proteobacteria)]